jgi:hypothetical protein
MMHAVQCFVAVFALLSVGCTGDTVALGNLPYASGEGDSGSAYDAAGGDALDDGQCGQVAYPPGPYGPQVGDVLDPTLQWQGPTTGQNPGELQGKTYYERTACIGLRALVILEVGWDSASDTVHQACLQAMTSTWSGGGVRIIELVSTASGGAPATPDDAAAWKNAKSSPLPVGADPSRSLFLDSSEQPPLAVVVDPCTMKITGRYAASPVDAVTALVAQGGCAP